MTAGNMLFAENFKVATISPQLVDDNNVVTGWLYAGNAANLVGIVSVGATDAAVTVSFEQATDGSGTGAKAITDAGAEFSATSDNKDGIFQVEATKLDVMGGFNYVQMKIAVANGDTGGYVSGVLLHESRHKPVTQPAKVIKNVQLVG